MTPESLHRLPGGALATSKAVELAKLEALRAIAEELAELKEGVMFLVNHYRAHGEAADGLAAARTELENVMNLFEAELSARLPRAELDQYLFLVERARALLRRHLS